jgi:pilus assembly protein CpaF
MVNGAGPHHHRGEGQGQETDIRFRDNGQLLNICQRIVSQVGRRVDESSPICDARLPDGSRVNVIAPPLSIDGPGAHDPQVQEGQADARPAGRLRLDQRRGRHHPPDHRPGALQRAGLGRHRAPARPTLLNTLTAYIDADERFITCEDAAELQLQQPHVVRLETRPPNIEGEGEITMRDLVKNCLRMRPRTDHRRRGARPGGRSICCRR